MKVGVFFGLDKNSGDAYHQALKTLNILSEIKEINFSFYNISSNKSKFFDKNIKSYSTNLLDKIFFLFYNSEFLKIFLKKFGIVNRFEIFVKKENIDIIFLLVTHVYPYFVAILIT